MHVSSIMKRNDLGKQIGRKVYPGVLGVTIAEQGKPETNDYYQGGTGSLEDCENGAANVKKIDGDLPSGGEERRGEPILSRFPI